jgi:hypothetical protein
MYFTDTLNQGLMLRVNNCFYLLKNIQNDGLSSINPWYYNFCIYKTITGGYFPETDKQLCIIKNKTN